MIVLKLLSGLAVLALVLLLPGVLIVRALAPDLRGPGGMAAGLAAGSLIVPTLGFGVAMLLGTNMNGWLMLGVAVLISVPCGLMLRRRRAPAPPAESPPADP